MPLSPEIAAVVLAAGKSTRMGQPKLVLPWGNRSVIGQVVSVLLDAGLTEIVVVTGGARESIKDSLKDFPVHFTHNPDYSKYEMIVSLQAGIRSLDTACQAFLVVLGDQPEIDPAVIHQMVNIYETNHPRLVIPSYQMHRGHPWLVDRSLWNELLAMPPDQTMRDFLHAHVSDITYLPVQSPEILMDIDTPQEYQARQGKISPPDPKQR